MGGSSVATVVRLVLPFLPAGLLLFSTAGAADMEGKSLHGLEVLQLQGKIDNIVLPEVAEKSRMTLESFGCCVRYLLLDDVGHWIPTRGSGRGLKTACDWLLERLPEESDSLGCPIDEMQLAALAAAQAEDIHAAIEWASLEDPFETAIQRAKKRNAIVPSCSALQQGKHITLLSRSLGPTSMLDFIRPEPAFIKSIFVDLSASRPTSRFVIPTPPKPSMLCAACQQGDLLQVQELLRDRADPNARHECGDTVLRDAAEGGNANIVALLLGHGADPKEFDDEAMAKLSSGARGFVELFRARGGPAPALSPLVETGDDGGETVEVILRDTPLDPAVLAQVFRGLRLDTRSRYPRDPVTNGPAPPLEVDVAPEHTAVIHHADSARPLLVLMPRHQRHTGTIIFLHGLLQSGAMIKHAAAALLRGMPHVRLVAPTAPGRASIFGFGPAWFDTLSHDPDDPSPRYLDVSCTEVHSLLQEELAAGVPLDRIILAGFSMGATLVAAACLALPRPPAGLLLFSTRALGPNAATRTDALIGLDVLQLQGGRDNIVREVRAQEAAAAMDERGWFVRYSVHEEAGHTLSASITNEARRWLSKKLPGEVDEAFMESTAARDASDVDAALKPSAAVDASAEEA
eukprot:NODE_1471_length_2465_cov_4.654405.p1 GENE.NODE_1471_length_2465_cov_4.654405~~NODE_1471_length_2465_cov_4.654405.p1  ORF type:complete len:724 (-),score=200.15 NODE_1471_length_2465_cov_4.654405:292-2184(-)